MKISLKLITVRRWTLGLTGYKDQIAVIRASGSISRTRGPFSSSSSGIIAEKLIEKIRSVRESKRFKAVVLRIDSPGGDALASDLMLFTTECGEKLDCWQNLNLL